MKTLIFLLAFCGSALSLLAADLVELHVYPPDVDLNNARDRQSMVVQAVYSDTVTRDVTAEAKLTLPDLVTRKGNTLHPAKDGKGELSVAFGGKTVKIPCAVTNAVAERPISFRLDVMPVLLKGGCNTGGCHGSGRGQDGFMLSLFGYDPAGDYKRITREQSGRRINLAIPENSMLLTKSTGKVQHTGGELFGEDSEYYSEVLRWLKAGVPDDPKDLAKPVSMEIMPDRIVLEGKDATQQLTVRVKYSDGSDRDITNLAVFQSNNDISAAVDDLGKITAGARGEAFVMARFHTYTLGAQVIVVPKNEPYEFPKDIKANNYIDELVHAKLKKLRIVPSEVCSDEVFLRRVSLDITGKLPTPNEYSSFVASKDPQKREFLVDELLGRKEFVDVWVMKWAELLQIRSNNNFSYKSALLYYSWLQEQFSNNVPIDQIVTEILSSSGGTFKNPATNYYQVETDKLKVAENVAQVFCGIRLQCAQCHNHPFDRWTMDDYYSWAGLFHRIGRKNSEDPRERIIYDVGSGDPKHPVGGKTMTPKFLGGDEHKSKSTTDRRQAVAKWLVSPDNPYFSKNLANITWAHFLGRGIVEPVDDVRISNPSTNPELLQEMGKQLAASGYDFRKLVRDICNSRTYQLSTQANDTNQTDSSNFSKGPIRRIRAEVLLDCLSSVTETKDKFKGLPLGARATEIADGNTSTYFLKTFGRASRDTVCSCEVVMEPNLSQALHLLNGDAVHNKVKAGNVVKRRLEAGAKPEQVIEDLYVRALARKPTETEASKLLMAVNAEENKQAALEDVFWALLNAKEFYFNH